MTAQIEVFEQLGSCLGDFARQIVLSTHHLLLSILIRENSMIRAGSVVVVMLVKKLYSSRCERDENSQLSITTQR